MPCELQFVEIPLLDHEDCQRSDLGKLYLAKTGRAYPKVQLCAGFTHGGRDACQVVGPCFAERSSV